jgi:activator of HSP90 ATPase
MKKDANASSNLIAPTNAPTRRQIITGAAVAFGGLALGSTARLARAADEISHAAESIHMEPVFTASRKRVYEVFLDAKQFDASTKLSEAMKSGKLPSAPTQISREVGGAFQLFGGFIIGRHLELVPDERIVQAWRVAYWDPGAFSIVKFMFVDQGAGTKIIFDHGGFPKGDAENLVAGWKGNYWEPIGKLLA